jgi:ParB family transcriptional regulator, chromosome partitioning protein
MKDETPRHRLGRGLAALLGETASEPAALQQARGQRRIPIEFLRPNPFNPRQAFSDEELAELTESVRKRGVLQPILVRAVADATDAFEIIAGERRWRAAQKAGLFDVPASVIDANDRQALEIAIIENVQRADLNAIEEARGYQKLCIEFGYSHSDLAVEIGKSRSHVANTLRLLNLPEDARQLLIDKVITAGHARALLGVDDPSFVARKIAEDNLTVRDVERLGRARSPSGERALETKQAIGFTSSHFGSETQALAREFSEALGLTVSIKQKGTGGFLSIRYDNPEQFDAIQRLLLRPL